MVCLLVFAVCILLTCVCCGAVVVCSAVVWCGVVWRSVGVGWASDSVRVRAFVFAGLYCW